MSLFTVVPTLDHDDADHASAILRHLVGEPLNVVYVLVGRPPGFERMLQTAIGRAEAFWETRRVVHVPDPEVLEPELLADLRGPRKTAVAAVYGLRDTIKKRLTAQKAQDPVAVELAFTASEEPR